MASAVFFLFFLLSSPFFSNASAEQKFGFSVDLIHRDSPKSPLYNPAEASSQRVRNALRRSVNRAVHFSSGVAAPNSLQAEITANFGEYLMNVSIGSPPFPIMVIADTGSDLIWTQCKPCYDCYQQEAPLFDPKRSTTYKDISCTAKQCKALDGARCSRNSGGTCEYSVSYGDRSHSIGAIAVDTLTLGSTDRRPVALQNTVFGCGHDNAGTFDEKAAGIIGLGGGAVSLISQLGSSIGGKFSYCLVPLSSEDLTSKINFGSNAIVSGTGAVSTPIVKKDPDTYYFLTLEAISVGGKKIDFTSSNIGTDEGNIIIDSGTTLTMLPSEFYFQIESAVAAAIKAKPVEDPEKVLSLCYRAINNLRVPTITVHFKGADVKLDSKNYFVQVSDNVICFSFAPSDQLAIYGNLAQMNFLVGYDTVSRKVSFKQTDCSKM